MSSRRSSTYSANIGMPGSSVRKSRRAPVTLVLCLLLPPLGLMYMWREGVFKARGRILLTALTTIEMMLVAVLLTPAASPAPILPVPGIPSRVTPAPQSNVLTALSNMDEILRQQQEANGVQATQGPSAAELLAQEENQRKEVMDTVVYCVYDSAVRYYHAAPVCGNQSNRRALTVQEAMSEGLGACPDCNPPVYGFTVSSETTTE